MPKSSFSPAWRLLLAVFLPLTLGACASTGTSEAAGSVLPFATDGCSLFPDRSPFGKSDWCNCCVMHDLAYWRGGTADARYKADEAFRTCVQQSSNGALALIMFAGVRVAATPYLKTTFRWGFGWQYYRPYGALTPEEVAAADKAERDYREQHPTLPCPGRGAACR